MNINFNALRPSTIARVIEDTAFAGAKAATNGVRKVSNVVGDAAAQARHDMDIELRARALVKARVEAEKAAVQVVLSPEQLACLEADMLEIHLRAAQIQAAKAAKV